MGALTSCDAPSSIRSCVVGEPGGEAFETGSLDPVAGYRAEDRRNVAGFDPVESTPLVYVVDERPECRDVGRRQPTATSEAFQARAHPPRFERCTVVDRLLSEAPQRDVDSEAGKSGHEMLPVLSGR